jgi:hypothetical protein
VAVWCGALAAFAVYLVRLGSFTATYGGLGTALVLILWMILFGVLYHATPSLRIPWRTARVRPEPDGDEVVPPALTERIDLVVKPSAALRNATAQGRMLSILGPRAGGLSEREVELMDWGFAFGVAWAVARDQDPGAPEELLSARALQVTQAVYEAYRGSTKPVLPEPPASAPHPHAHGHGAPHSPHLSAQHN